MEVDLEVSKSMGNVNIISEKGMLINKPKTSLTQEPLSRSYDPSYEAPINGHDQVFVSRSYSSDMFHSERSLDNDSMFTASGETDPGGSYADREGYAGSLRMHTAKSYGAVGVSSQNGETSLLLLSEFDPFPVTVTCSKCQKKIETKLKYKPGKVTCLWSVALTPLLCCFLPCCISLAKDVYHTCPDCGTTLGVYKRSCCDGRS